MMLVNVGHPANATKFISFIFTVAAFDLFEFIEPMLEDLFKFEAKGAILSDWEILGYESTDMMINLGLIFLLWVLTDEIGVVLYEFAVKCIIDKINPGYFNTLLKMTDMLHH